MVAKGLSDALEDSKDDQFSELHDAIADRVAYGQNCLEKAEKDFEAGDADAAWLSLIRASIEMGAVDALLQAVWITPRALAARKGREKATQAFEERRAAAVKHFLTNFGKPSTKAEAIDKLEASMELHGLAVGPNPRTSLYAQHPEIKTLISSLPRRPKQ